ncbi:6073_t:CDS:2 [Rhizophagus irregularis]|nr:6073_t:CDS:2 [Rhizophagus irregularis]
MLSDNNSNTIATSTIINQINVVNEESKNVEEQKSLLNKFPPPPKTTFPSKITTTPTYICSGTIDWNMLEGEDFLGIWLAADEFMLDDLEKQVRELFEKKSEKLKSNFISIVKLVYQNDALERFRSNCVDIINTTTWFQDCHNFKTLDESIFQSLLSEEENFVHDGVIWNLLILWACSSKNPILNTNKVMEWSDKEFELLKSRIEHFIPYIRFSMISRNDYYNHVLPYRRILPADTTNNAALQYYFYCLDEEGNPKPDVLRPHVILNDSNIINHTHVAMIGRWIDTGREKENCTQDSCSNSVISVDDNLSLNEDQEIPPCNITSAETTKNSNSRNEEKGSMKISWKQSSPLKKLWTLRKNRRPVYPNDSSSTTTPSTTKKENNNERLHVFSSSDTKKYPYEVTVCSPDAFIFSFGEGDNPEEDAILSRVSKQYSQFAICRTVQGPGFGNYDLGIRLEYKNLPKKIVCNQKYYEKKIIVPNESNEFTFDDIEVFKIIKEEV